jgi:hypothetical protein
MIFMSYFMREIMRRLIDAAYSAAIYDDALPAMRHYLLPPQVPLRHYAAVYDDIYASRLPIFCDLSRFLTPDLRRALPTREIF